MKLGRKFRLVIKLFEFSRRYEDVTSGDGRWHSTIPLDNIASRLRSFFPPFEINSLTPGARCEVTGKKVTFDEECHRRGKIVTEKRRTCPECEMISHWKIFWRGNVSIVRCSVGVQKVAVCICVMRMCVNSKCVDGGMITHKISANVWNIHSHELLIRRGEWDDSVLWSCWIRAGCGETWTCLELHGYESSFRSMSKFVRPSVHYVDWNLTSSFKPSGCKQPPAKHLRDSVITKVFKFE